MINQTMFEEIKTLPDPLCTPSGVAITDPADWPAQRALLLRDVRDILYGPWPAADGAPRLTVLSTEAADGVVREEAQIHYQYGGKPYTLDVHILRPDRDGAFPVITYNNHRVPTWPSEPDAGLCVAEYGYAVAEFAREMIAPDPQISAFAGQAPLDRYPPLACGAILAWAWGHSLVIDCLQGTPWSNGQYVATGASRGGKAALAAGIFDPRIAVTAPDISGCGGTGCLRYVGTTTGERQDPTKCETVGGITVNFPDWFIQPFGTYGTQTPPFPIEKECTLPFDAHTLRALVAPRAVISMDGAEDYWANLYGTQLAWHAAQPVFDLLGAPRHNAFFWRPGGHAFTREAWTALLDFSDFVLRQKAWPEQVNIPYFR